VSLMWNWILKLEKNWERLLANECNLSFCLNDMFGLNELEACDRFKGPEDSKSVSMEVFLDTKIV
jgi:hypothetical protein